MNNTSGYTSSSISITITNKKPEFHIKIVKNEEWREVDFKPYYRGCIVARNNVVIWRTKRYKCKSTLIQAIDNFALVTGIEIRGG